MSEWNQLQLKNGNGLSITEVQIWPLRTREASRVKAMVAITFNDTLRISGCRIIEGAKGLFLSYPSEKKPGSDQFYPLAHVIFRPASDEVQEVVITRYKELVEA